MGNININNKQSKAEALTQACLLCSGAQVSSSLLQSQTMSPPLVLLVPELQHKLLKRTHTLYVIVSSPGTGTNIQLKQLIF